MIPGLDDYLRRLERELRLHGFYDRRILDEAREHLVDAIEDGRHRGLSDADAEQEALERFGAPEAIAAYMLSERDRIMDRFAAALDTVRQRKWWILAPTVLAAVVTSITSYYFLPIRYRSDTLIFASQRVSENYVRATVTTKIEDRLRSINQQVRSRTRLERIIEDFNLYPERRKTDTMQDIVEDMSQAIDIDIVQGDVFRVAFSSDSPRTAMLVTERLASFFIDENLRDRTAPVDRIAANLERRQIGGQFRVLDLPRLPEGPVGPDRLRVNAAGTFAGFGLGLVLVGLRRKLQKTAA